MGQLRVKILVLFTVIVNNYIGKVEKPLIPLRYAADLVMLGFRVVLK